MFGKRIPVSVPNFRNIQMNTFGAPVIQRVTVIFHAHTHIALVLPVVLILDIEFYACNS